VSRKGHTQGSALVNVQPHAHMPRLPHCPALLQYAVWLFSGSVDPLERDSMEPRQEIEKSKIQVVLGKISCKPLL